MISGALPSRSTTILAMTTIVEYARMSLSLSLSLRSFFSSSTLLKPVLNPEFETWYIWSIQSLADQGQGDEFFNKTNSGGNKFRVVGSVGRELSLVLLLQMKDELFLIKTKTSTGAKKFRVVDRLGKSAWLLKQLPHPYAARCRELSRLLRVSEATGCGPSGRMEKRRRWRL